MTEETLSSSGGVPTSTTEEQLRPQETFTIQPGEAFYSPPGYHHYFAGVSEDNPLFGLAIFDTNDLQTYDFPQVLKNMEPSIITQVSLNSISIERGARSSDVDDR